MQVNQIDVLGDINVVSVSLKFFGGSASLTAEDLGVDTTNLPPDVVALGSKKIVDKNLLNGFNAARKNIQRKGLLKGTSFLGGFGMSPEASKEFLAEIDPIITELENDVEQFLKNYPTYVQDWANMHPQWTSAILAAAPSVQSVRSRFQFKVRCFKVSQPGEQLGDGGLTEEITGLAGQILTEISKDVKLTWKDRGYGAQQIKSLLRRVSEKAKSLSFINADLAKLTKLVDDILVTLPPSGKIEGVDYLKLKGLMDLLLDPQAVLSSMTKGNLSVEIQEPAAEVQAAPEVQVSEPALQIAAPVMDSSESNVQVEVIQLDQPTLTDTVPSVVIPQEPKAKSRSSWAW